MPTHTGTHHLKSVVIMAPNDFMIDGETNGERIIPIREIEFVLDEIMTASMTKRMFVEGVWEAEFALKVTNPFLEGLIPKRVDEIPEFRGQVASHIRKVKNALFKQKVTW